VEGLLMSEEINFDEVILSNMILDLKKMELYLDENNWENEDKILEYNQLENDILSYLKKVL
jgi:hypothetical protein